MDPYQADFQIPPSPDHVRYMFIDFNAYFASVEQYDDPSIAGKPVIVTPLASEHSGAIAASYEAKALGISRGTSVVEARKLCPAIAIRPARHDRYVQLHLQLMDAIREHLPITRVHSIDECVCRLSREEWEIDRAKDKALAVKRGIRAKFGTSIRCSIGLAPSPVLAKLASDLHKPDGLTALPISALPDSLANLPLRAIPGIGAGIEQRLLHAGIYDFSRLWSIEPRHARKIWGSVAGERFVYGLHGHDLPIIPEPQDKKMIGHSRVLSGIDRQPERARIVARSLLLKAASRLRLHGLYACGLQFGLRLYSGARLSQDIPLRATQNSWRFLAALDAGWRMLGDRIGKSHGSAVKMVTVYLHSLRPSPPDPDLFISKQDDLRDMREANMWHRIDRVNQRYGMAKVILASQSDVDLDYLGVKIAFSRIPELAEFADIRTIRPDIGTQKSKRNEGYAVRLAETAGTGI